MKQFVKALDKSERGFSCICLAFSGLSIKKIKSSVFDGPQIRQLLRLIFNNFFGAKVQDIAFR